MLKKDTPPPPSRQKSVWIALFLRYYLQFISESILLKTISAVSLSLEGSTYINWILLDWPSFNLSVWNIGTGSTRSQDWYMRRKCKKSNSNEISKFGDKGGIFFSTVKCPLPINFENVSKQKWKADRKWPPPFFGHLIVKNYKLEALKHP